MYPAEALHRLPNAVLAPLSSLLRASTLIHITKYEGSQPGRRLWRERDSARRTLILLAAARPALKATLPLVAELAQCVAERTALALMLDGNYQAAQGQVGPRRRRVCRCHERRADDPSTLPCRHVPPCCSVSNCSNRS